MIAKLLSIYILLQVDSTYLYLIHRYLLQLKGKSRLGIHILWRYGLVARLFQSLLIRCAVLLYQSYVVGAVVLLGGSHHIGLGKALNTFNLIERILPGLAFREQIYQLLRTAADSLQILLGTHHHLLFQSLKLCIAKVAVHHLLNLLHHTCLGCFHLSKKFWNDEHSSTSGIVETYVHGE